MSHANLLYSHPLTLSEGVGTNEKESVCAARKRSEPYPNTVTRKAETSLATWEAVI